MNQLSLPENGTNSSNRFSSQKDDADYDRVTNESIPVHSDNLERVGNNDSVTISASANESTDSNQNINDVSYSDDEEVDTTAPKIKPEKSEYSNETDSEPEAPQSNHELNVCRRHLKHCQE